MKDNIKVSVIIPVYNTERYLKECLDSVFSQTLKEIEVIAVDDGSTDNSLKILYEYQKIHNNLMIFTQKNKKQGAARNVGIDHAKGETVLFLDSDDSLQKNALSLLFTQLKNQKLDIVTFDALAYDDETKEKFLQNYNRSELGIDESTIYKGIEFWERYEKCGATLSNVCFTLYRKSFLERANFRFQENVFYEDNEFAINTYIKAERMMYTSQRLYMRRYRPCSTMTSEYTVVHLIGMIRCFHIVWKNIISDFDAMNKKDMFVRYLLGRINSVKQIWKEMGYIWDLNIEQEWFFFLDSALRYSFEKINKLSVYINMQELYTMLQSKGKLENLMLERFDAFLTKYRIALYKELIENDNKKNICIYGIGNVGKTVIDVLESSINAENRIICAVTTKDVFQEQYEGYSLIEISELDEGLADVVIIASIKYENEMVNEIQNRYGTKYIIKKISDIW